MFISIVVPHYGDSEEINSFLQTINSLDYPKKEFEVIVINNNPSEIDIKSPSPKLNLKILHQPKPGSYAARNAGVIASKGRIIAFTDSDCRPKSDWISKASSIFKKDESIERLMGNVVLFPSCSRFSIGWIVDSAISFPQKLYYLQRRSPTANLFVKRNKFIEVGFFNENLLSGGDFEWSLNASKLGVKLAYIDDVIVYHPSRKLIEIYKKRRRTFGGAFANFYQKGKSHYLFFYAITPPVKLLFDLIKIGRPVLKVILAFFVIWFFNLCYTFEFLRLALGGSPRRD